MSRLEDLTPGARLTGLLPARTVEVVQLTWHGTQAATLTYRDSDGRVGEQLLYRDDEARLLLEAPGPAFAFDGDGALFRLASEALRIRLAYLFDPLLAVHTSVIEPLPHQIEAVYDKLLPRQPLRFLLADDPGAGKTIIAGMYINELMYRADVKRCLVICSGGLIEQWQDELHDKFGLSFEIVTRETIENSRSANPFAEKNLVIARLDHLARNDDLIAKLEQTDWDLVVVDEAHKMSAHYFGNEVKETKRYKLGKLVGGLTRHLLLMTATPHSGKEADFQLFMALLDADRFEGRFRDGVHSTDASDLMRRMVKEELLRFDGRRLFPERRAYSVEYKLSDEEAHLYEEVTEYVREEMNRAERLKAEGEGRRGAVVGFALTILQRRLASSPEAIYQSLKRRRKRLEDRLRDEELLKRGREARLAGRLLELDEEDIQTIDERPDEEIEELEEEVVAIHGGMGREQRRKTQEAFAQDKEVLILVATDAAGEGINLQRAHLMVNYDLPWNPNRIEQRFGRIHRIGQTEDWQSAQSPARE